MGWGWIVATFIFAIAWIGTIWFAGSVIMNLYNRQRAFQEELEERLDSSLKVLDESFMKIAMVANKPVFFDSPEVRAVVSAIQRARDAVVAVADILSDIEIEDKTADVTPKSAEYITKEDPHDPKSAAELDHETRNEMIKKAVREGRMDVIDPIGTYTDAAQNQRSQQPRQSTKTGMRAAAALVRQQARIRQAKATKGKAVDG